MLGGTSELDEAGIFVSSTTRLLMSPSLTLSLFS